MPRGVSSPSGPLALVGTHTLTLGISDGRFEDAETVTITVPPPGASPSLRGQVVTLMEPAIKHAVHRLSVLVGESPGTLAGRWLEAAPIPATPPEVPVGLPSELLRRRPDIRRAERELAAATARIGIATADLFPRFSLTGALGLQSVAASDFFTGGSGFFSLGPAIHWPIFNAGRIRQNIKFTSSRPATRTSATRLRTDGAHRDRRSGKCAGRLPPGAACTG